MSTTFKGSCTSVGGVACNANTAVTWAGGTPGSGDSIVVFVYCTTAVNDFTGVTDSAGNTYTQDYSYVDGASAGHAVYIAKGIGGTTPAWIRIGKTSTSNICFVASAHAGVFSGAVEGITQYTEGASTTSHSIPYTTANSNDLVLMLYHGGTDIPTPTALGSWGWVDGNRNATDMFYLSDAGAPGSYNFTFTGPVFAANMVRAVYRAVVTDPIVSTVTGSTVTEGAVNRFTATLSAATNRTTNYPVAFGGTAVAGTDFDSNLANATFSTGASFVSGQGQIQVMTGYSVVTFDVPTVDNALNQFDRTLICQIGGVVSTGGNILDNDPLPAASVGAGVANGSSVTFLVTLNTASGRSLTVNYATSNGVGLAGTDYPATSGTLTFAAGEVSKAVVVNRL